MIMWMTRDKTWAPQIIKLWSEEPHRYLKGNNYDCPTDDYWPVIAPMCAEFKALTGQSLPRKGSKRKVDVKITIKGIK